MQAHAHVLKDVIGLFPAFDTGIPAQHLPRELMEPATRAIEQFLPRSCIALFEALDPAQHQIGGMASINHEAVIVNSHPLKCNARTSKQNQAFVFFCPVELATVAYLVRTDVAST
jgi:hypothetical protein